MQHLGYVWNAYLAELFVFTFWFKCSICLAVIIFTSSINWSHHISDEMQLIQLNIIRNHITLQMRCNQSNIIHIHIDISKCINSDHTYILFKISVLNILLSYGFSFVSLSLFFFFFLLRIKFIKFPFKTTKGKEKKKEKRKQKTGKKKIALQSSYIWPN